jgi:hypothetical protein
MNIILLNQENWIDPWVALVRDCRADHRRQLLKSAVGDTVRVGCWAVTAV